MTTILLIVIACLLWRIGNKLDGLTAAAWAIEAEAVAHRIAPAEDPHWQAKIQGVCIHPKGCGTPGHCTDAGQCLA